MRSRTISKLTCRVRRIGLDRSACGDDDSASTPTTTRVVAPPPLRARRRPEAGRSADRDRHRRQQVWLGLHPTKGIVNNEILIGQSVPQSGPFAGFGCLSTALKAYFDYANAELNGVNGKKLKLSSKTTRTNRSARRRTSTISSARRCIRVLGCARYAQQSRGVGQAQRAMHPASVPLDRCA